MKKGIERICLLGCVFTNVVTPILGFGIFETINALPGQVTNHPSPKPSVQPSHFPTLTPTLVKSQAPSHQPSIDPSISPTKVPSTQPSEHPSGKPTSKPSNAPTATPTYLPSQIPSMSPSYIPSQIPSISPSHAPSVNPTMNPTQQPSYVPSNIPTSLPSSKPSDQPTFKPTSQPSQIPSNFHSQRPTSIIHKLSLEDTQGEANTNQAIPRKNKRNVSFVIIGASMVLVAIVAGVFLVSNISRRRNNECDLFDIRDFEEDEYLDNVSNVVEDDCSEFNASTIQSGKTSAWRKRMQNETEQEEDVASQIYPNSVFQASTIKSEGSWIRRTALPTSALQSSVLDIDFFEDKPIPDHVMCVQSQSEAEI